MQKETYTSPVTEIVRFETEDIITTSNNELPPITASLFD